MVILANGAETLWLCVSNWELPVLNLHIYCNKIAASTTLAIHAHSQEGRSYSSQDM